MKILLMNNGYPSEMRPQYSSYIRSIEECLIHAGANVELLVMPSDFKTGLGKVVHYLNYYKTILFFKRFSEFNVIFINHYPNFALPFLFRLTSMKQIVFHWHGSDLLPKGKYKRNLFLFFIKLLLKRKKNTIHISPSGYFAKEIANYLPIEKEKIIISPSGGIKEENYIPVEVMPNEKIKIGFASELSEEKGVELFSGLIKSSSEFEKMFNKKIEFHYIYYGKQKEIYADIFTAFKNVIKWNVLKYGTMSAFYNAIDVLIFPTKGESLGLVGLEAMFCNKPVIGTNKFALPEYIIPNLTGETFECGNLNSLKLSLIKCIKNLSAYNPRSFVLEKYSRGKVVEQYKELLNSIHA